MWLLFATILGAIVGGAVVYFSVDTSPESDTSAGDAPAVTTTTLAPDETTTTTVAPVTVDSTLDFAYQASYPVEGSSTGLITLTDGVGQEALPDSDSSLTVTILQTIPADLDGDEIAEAVVLLSVTTGDTGIFHFVHGVFNDPDGILATNGVPLGDRIAIDDVAVDPVSGSVTVRYQHRSDQVAFSEPHDLLVVSDLQILTFGASEVGRGVIALADANDPQLTAATITTGGLGPIRIGMTVEEATEASGLAVVGPTEGVVEASPGCGFARVDGFDGVGLMLIDGVIARVDVDSGPTATASGAMIGSTEEEIKTLFPGVITVSPHQYVDGNYLTLTPTAENLVDFRVVFETDGELVTSYRAGRTPEVEWIEGCA